MWHINKSLDSVWSRKKCANLREREREREREQNQNMDKHKRERVSEREHHSILKDWNVTCVLLLFIYNFARTHTCICAN